MPIKPVWDADGQAWEWLIRCEYCLEPVYSRGPEGRGDRDAALALTDDGVVPFCSSACRAFWDGVSGRQTHKVADGVGPQALFGLLPDGANGRVKWPDTEDTSHSPS